MDYANAGDAKLILLLILAVAEFLQLVKTRAFGAIIEPALRCNKGRRRNATINGRSALWTELQRRLVQLLQLLETGLAVRAAFLIVPADVLAKRHSDYAFRQGRPAPSPPLGEVSYFTPGSWTGAALSGTTIGALVEESPC